MRFADMLSLAEHGTDVFVARGPEYPWGGLYGGHIVTQGLAAAAATVEPTHRPHSLRAYFIRPGDAAEPVRYEVDRIRNGKTFSTRRVVARQAVGAILNLEASFQVHEPTGSVQTIQRDEVVGPDELVNDSWTPMFERRFVPGTDARGRTRCWFRMTEELPDDPLVHACALAYMSDDLPTDAVFRVNPLGGPADHETAFSVSLDHTLWFHRALRADEWHLQDVTCHGFTDGRGLAIGHVHTPDGTHAATLAQEILLRRRRG
jgi:acyl-CoA thioesterase II